MMKLKLSFDDPKFFVNEKKKIVTCVMHCQLKCLGDTKGYWDALKDIADITIGYDNSIRYGFTVTEISRVYPGDVFDVEVGKKVARARAESMAYEHVAKEIIKSTSNFVSQLGNLAGDFIEKSNSVIGHNDKFLKQF